MIITKKAIPRRTVLRGLGTTLALPLLESMVPALKALATTDAKVARRFSVMYVAHGYAPGYWLPKNDGPNYELTQPLLPLAGFKDRMLLLSGVDNAAALQRPGDPRGGHGRMAPAFMCGVHAKPTQGADFQAGVSVDQIAAQHLGKETQLPSLQLSLEPVDFSGSCDSGYSCVYTNTLCWRGPTMPLPMEDNPRAVFERLFGDAGTTDGKLRAKRLREKRSILDSVLDKAQALGESTSPADRRLFDEYLQSIRDVEKRLETAEAQSSRELPVVAQPASVPSTFPDYAKLMLDLQVLAYQADLTRVSTFMLAKELSGRTYPEIGVAEGHHALSHHGDIEDKLKMLAKVNSHHTSMLAYFLERLKATPDGDGTLFDHSVVLYGSGHGDPNKHDPINVPLIIVGGDLIKGGRHVRFEHQQVANVHLGLLHKLGVPAETVGDGKQPIALDAIAL
ncbi:MAG TPA: DUF1552 domain-containing protein [Vicinamibacterales bacterium]